ncbi:alanyl-tRNA editing protein [Palleronia pelagia]|uniref:Ala-tRNA(Pro) hydrolase n=1 Tax=Palleronia pelagia TaxID=387096 RepID=A0A1H8AEB0_9RHOB|nr:alanyl-tRNA editing protein [Palleronia pelagia]SEM68883.1 Ala-tRNA(Pro) hydrolase [Palleronia pelagia]
MTDLLHLDDPFRKTATGQVVETGDGWVRVDPCLFYATGGGQPGDTGEIRWDGGQAKVTICEKGADGAPILRLADGAAPDEGLPVEQAIDWDRRWGHMRVHTALHLLSVVVPLPVTGGAISVEKGRLDFAMPDPPEDKDAIERALNDLVARDLAVGTDWITEDELDANPGLVKTMSVQPPRGAGRIRLVRIGQGDDQVDLQPCGGTHVSTTGQIGRLRLGKVEKKSATSRRITLHLA